jgi:hypothetical protein
MVALVAKAVPVDGVLDRDLRMGEPPMRVGNVAGAQDLVPSGERARNDCGPHEVLRKESSEKPLDPHEESERGG